MIKDSRTVWEVHPQSPELGAREGETDKNPPKGTPRQRRRAVRSFQKGEVFFFFFISASRRPMSLGEWLQPAGGEVKEGSRQGLPRRPAFLILVPRPRPQNHLG